MARPRNPTPAVSQETSAIAYHTLALDALVHAPSRLAILTALAAQGEEVSFPALEKATALNKSNLGMQTAKLEQAGYITMRKYLKGKFAATRYGLTPTGQAALAAYWGHLLALHGYSSAQEPQQESVLV